MIIFDLACEQEHRFEGWFSSQATYDTQLADGLISCPQCGSSEIRRVPSAIHLTSPSSVPRASSEPASATAQMNALAAGQRILSAIVANCEDVGHDFAQEARKIHYAEAPLRSIRGQASDNEYESLREEGIEVLRLPIVKKGDLN